MADEKKIEGKSLPDEAFLARWSRRKLEADAPAPEPKPAAPMPELPPVESLTPESDFKGFMDPRVGDALRRVALKKLFNDPHFNLPDSFEPFSGDWTGAEPIPEAMLATLEQMKTMLRQPPQEQAAASPAVAAPQEPVKEEAKPADEPRREDA